MKQRNIILTGTMICLMQSLYGQEVDKPLLWMNLDEIEIERNMVEMVRGETFLPKEKMAYVMDEVKGEQSEIYGKYYESVNGVKGNALLLDGYTSYIEIPGEKAPVVMNDFSLEAWIALGAYPTHLCPIIDNKHDVNIGYHNGYSFNINALGQLNFRMATRGHTEQLIVPQTLPLNKWIHVAAVYDEREGMKIYLNGELAGQKEVKGKFVPALGIDIDESVSNLSMLIGRSRVKAKPFGTLRPYGTQDHHSFFDGLIDEVKVFNTALTSKYISSGFKRNNTGDAPQLPDRTLPSGPDGTGRFGAVNTTLDYYPAWDAPWHVGESADVVVQFDESPCKFVFWRGTNYIPNFVTENGIWFNNAFNEGWNENGSCEPMSDKRNTYSYVKILENTDARVVVLWRYGLVDNWNNFAFTDPKTGWGDWVEETYYMYPDMTGIRKDVLFSNAPRAAHEWQESIMVLSPGQSPEDILEYGALTLANMKGEKHTYSWEHETPPFLPEKPENHNIKVINTKSEYYPFSIMRPEDNPYSDIYAGEIRRDVSVFPWWNHWPVAVKPTDGRSAMFSDRPAHSSLSHWHWDAQEMTDNSVTKIMLIGLTDQNVDGLVSMAKSWINAPAVSHNSSLITSANYDQTEKSYIIELEKPGKVQFEVEASADAPMINPAFVITNWGIDDISLTLNGKKIERGKKFRYGFRSGLESTDLIIWLRANSDEVNQFIIEKQ